MPLHLHVIIALMLYRIGYTIFLLISIITLPWYVYVFFIIAGMYLFDFFYESLFFAVFSDVIYDNNTDIALWYTTLLTGMFLVVEWSKSKISYYD